MITGMPRVAIAVHDFDGVRDLFREAFGMPVIDLSESSVASLGARLGMCVPAGGSNIELMSPADPGAPLAQSLQNFLDRRGQGLFALMLEARVPDDEAEELLRRGMNVLPLMVGAGGRDIHPKSAHGVLIRVYPTGSFTGTMADPEQSLGISGIKRVLIAVRDIDRAAVTFGEQLGLRTDAVTSDGERGVAIVRCYPPDGGVIDLIAPADPKGPGAVEINQQLERRGEGLFALVLNVLSVSDVSTRLAQRGVVLTDQAFGAAVEVFGTRILIEQEGNA